MKLLLKFNLIFILLFGTGLVFVARIAYQFLIENCMKGVSHAIVFERPTNVSQGEAQLMQTQL